MHYNPQFIERKWQERWKTLKTFSVEVDLSKPKYYVLDMFPYPSGAGLHVGHVTGYTVTDIIARYKRMKGFNVLHPMGWDSFGLPAEQYAIRTGTHPAVTTAANIQTYKRQLESLGFSYDWDREIATSDPSYYKWTQWIFTKLYEKGLAYEAEALVNFCPALGTVLANEEVENGKAKEGGYPIERRPLKQWVLKITAYAERLLEDLEALDWPESLKRLQTHWIGKSEGVEVLFKEKNSKESLAIFTTRIDTLMGVSYVVIAPEHPLVKKVTTKEQKEAVEEYCRKVARLSDLERTDLAEEKTGVWTGAYVEHPLTQKLLPLWIADYVLMQYGCGAVMGVPAHDERDFNFAKKFSLPVLSVMEEGDSLLPYKEEGVLKESGQFSGLHSKEAKIAITHVLEEKGLGKKSIHYKLRDWLFSRQRYWGEPFPLLHLEDGSKRLLGIEELPLCPPNLESFAPSPTGESPLARAKEWIEIKDPLTGKKAQRDSNTMPQWAGSCWYYLRFCDPHNEKAAFSSEKENYWMPVDLYVGGVEHAVLHLLYARFWHKVLFDCGLVSTKEPFQSLKNQGLITARSYKLAQGGYVSPEEVIEKEGGFYQVGSGKKLESQIEKMSKSKLNGISPDQLIEEFGADAIRLYAMFMGPFDQEKVWNTDAVQGCYRFLKRFYQLFTSAKVVEESDRQSVKLIHKLIHQVERAMENFSFNTAIAYMMEFMNAFVPLPCYSKGVLKLFSQVLSPFAPHLAQEAWEALGEEGFLDTTTFPQADPAYLVEDKVTYVVQINGKVRGKWEVQKGTEEKELLDFFKKQPEISRHLSRDIEKVIHIPDRLFNLVLVAET